MHIKDLRAGRVSEWKPGEWTVHHLSSPAHTTGRDYDTFSNQEDALQCLLQYEETRPELVEITEADAWGRLLKILDEYPFEKFSRRGDIVYIQTSHGEVEIVPNEQSLYHEDFTYCRAFYTFQVCYDPRFRWISLPGVMKRYATQMQHISELMNTIHVEFTYNLFRKEA